MFKPKKIKQTPVQNEPNIVCIDGKWFEKKLVCERVTKVEPDEKPQELTKPKDVKVTPLNSKVSGAALCGGWLLAGASLAVLIIVLFTKALA
jgi:hypothetical protein